MFKECVKVVMILMNSFPESHIIVDNSDFNLSYKGGKYSITTKRGVARSAKSYRSILNIIDEELFSGNPKVSSRR